MVKYRPPDRQSSSLAVFWVNDGVEAVEIHLCIGRQPKMLFALRVPDDRSQRHRTVERSQISSFDRKCEPFLARQQSASQSSTFHRFPAPASNEHYELNLMFPPIARFCRVDKKHRDQSSQSIVLGTSDEPAVVPEQAASWQVEPSFGQR